MADPKHHLPFAERSDKDQKRRKGMPSLEDLMPILGKDKELECLDYLIQKDILTVQRCPNCTGPCALRAKTYMYRCRRCNFSQSIVS